VSDAGKISSLYLTRRVGYLVPVIPSSLSGRQTLIQYKSLWVMVVAMLGARIREGGGLRFKGGVAERRAMMERANGGAGEETGGAMR
jgi:hypothetical protein